MKDAGPVDTEVVEVMVVVDGCLLPGCLAKEENGAVASA